MVFWRAAVDPQGSVTKRALPCRRVSHFLDETGTSPFWPQVRSPVISWPVNGFFFLSSLISGALNHYHHDYLSLCHITKGGPPAKPLDPAWIIFTPDPGIFFQWLRFSRRYSSNQAAALSVLFFAAVMVIVAIYIKVSSAKEDKSL